MALRPKQVIFTKAIARLMLHAEVLGLELTFGDAYRDPRVTYGHKYSTHRSRLAVDFNLPNDIGHDKLHDYWDTIGGAERILEDLNHYSFEHNGIR